MKKLLIALLAFALLICASAEELSAEWARHKDEGTQMTVQEGACQAVLLFDSMESLELDCYDGKTLPGYASGYDWLREIVEEFRDSTTIFSEIQYEPLSLDSGKEAIEDYGLAVSDGTSYCSAMILDLEGVTTLIVTGTDGDVDAARAFLRSVLEQIGEPAQ